MISNRNTTTTLMLSVTPTPVNMTAPSQHTHKSEKTLSKEWIERIVSEFENNYSGIGETVKSDEIAWEELRGLEYYDFEQRDGQWIVCSTERTATPTETNLLNELKTTHAALTKAHNWIDFIDDASRPFSPYHYEDDVLPWIKERDKNAIQQQ
jgi:hypothetical protein